MPDGPVQAWALFGHCFTCGKDIVAASRIARALTEFGIAVLRFDFTGIGQSEGDFSHTTFTSKIKDLVAAADFLRENHEAPTILIGHSLGGAAVIAARSEIPETKAVVTIGAPADPVHVTHLFSDLRDVIEAQGCATVSLAGRDFDIRREFLDDIAAQPQRERIETLDAALLILHSPTDELVGVDNARDIYLAARHPKSFVSLDGADHLLTDLRDAAYTANIIAAWSARYTRPAEAKKPVETAPEGTVIVAETDGGLYAQHIAAGRHILRADEPRPVGDDSGPSPYDLLLASLGACTSMTLRMYAKRKRLPLDGVHVALKHKRVHAKDCADVAAKSGFVDQIDRVITISGDLDDQQRADLMKIADRCPVHRTLHSEIHVTTRQA
ncbi:alpha/beta fold hydrolase [Hoyosella rhizosphaerae]|nr:alpha/beta fold hydrolase [Hoyosella rhizosphaerae]